MDLHADNVMDLLIMITTYTLRAIWTYTPIMIRPYTIKVITVSYANY